MAALGLPIALALGVLADLAGGLASRIFAGKRGWWRTGLWHEARRLGRTRSRRARPTTMETLGAVAAAAGGGLAAAAALGFVPGSAALAYLSLALGLVGLRLGDPMGSQAREEEAASNRRLAALAEPALVVSLGALLLRWGAFDLDAVRATQTVLGPGLSVGPAAAGVAVALAGLAAVASGALRLGPAPEAAARRERQSRGAGTRLLGLFGRWALAGGTSLVVATLVAGHRLDASADALPFGGAVLVAAVLIGVGSSVFGRLSALWRALAAGAALLLAATAATLAALA
jgi:hypothetical protein